MKVVIFLLLTSLITEVEANANSCIEVIKASKLYSKTVNTKSIIEAHATSFCKIYKESNGSEKSANYGGSYKVLSLSMSNSKSSTKDVFEYYCKSDNSGYAKDTFYELYVEQIAPGAYSSFNQCINMNKKGLSVNFDNSLLSRTILFTVGFTSGDAGATAVISTTTSKDVKCKWPNSRSSIVTLKGNESKPLLCTRDKISNTSTIRINRDNAPNQFMSLKWNKYIDDEIPFNVVAELEKKHNALINKSNALLNSIENSVVSFNSAVCPEGWKEFEPAYGRFVRGLDKSDKLIDPEATGRYIGSIQNDSVRKHSHAQRYYNHKGHFNHEGDEYVPFVTIHSDSKGQPTHDFGGEETRPKNIALLYCIRE